MTPTEAKYYANSLQRSLDSLKTVEELPTTHAIVVLATAIGSLLELGATLAKESVSNEHNHSPSR